MKYEFEIIDGRFAIIADGIEIYACNTECIKPRKFYNAKALVLEAAIMSHTDIAPELCEDIALRVLENGYTRHRNGWGEEETVTISE